jgi:hypothetical protein
MRSRTTAGVLAALSILLSILTAPTIHAQTGAPLSFIAIGDAGEPGPILNENARAMSSVAETLRRRGAPVNLLLFLGDNFYPNGLNRSEEDRAHLIRDVLGPVEPLMREIGRDDVHAVAGNHDYYCRTVNRIPFDACNAGNEYEREIDLWSYHYYNPALVRRAVAGGSADSVDLIMFDSNYLLVRPLVYWRPVIDSLERLLRRSAASPGVKWRLFVCHHSPYTVGEHAGWRRWLPDRKRVGYMGNCREEGMDPFRYLFQFFSNQDNCTAAYRAYTDTIMAVLGRSGARVQALLAGHEHSLQFLSLPAGDGTAPTNFVISGAGSKRERVMSPMPPRAWTRPINDEIEQGRSIAGFVVGTFEKEGLALAFIDGSTGEPADMGGGAKRFVIDVSGALVGTQ